MPGLRHLFTFLLLLLQISGEAYDYIVVGAGTSGSIISARLAMEGHQVLLLEKGPQSTAPNAMGIPNSYVPRYEPDLLLDEDSVDSFYSEPMESALGKRLPIKVAKGLGGTSRLSKFYARPPLEEFDTWNLPGWGAADVEEFFKAYEGRPSGGDRNGNMGPIPIFSGQTHGGADGFVQGAKNLVFPEVDFASGSSTVGVGYLDHTQNPAHFRVNSGLVYVGGMNLPTRETIFGAAVTRVVFDKYSNPIVATGVDYSKDGVTKFVQCRKEVILAAGTFGTPLILERSGVGNGEMIKQHSVKPLIELPGVGENLIMLPSFTTWHRLSDIYPEQNLTGYFDSSNFAAFGGGAGGFLAYHHASAMLAASASASQFPDFTISYSSIFPPFLVPPGGVISECTLVNPQSRGSTHLRSSNHHDDPIVQPNLYSNPADLGNSIACLGTLRGVYAASFPVIQYDEEILPSGSFSTPETMAYFIMSQTTASPESFGTAKMGEETDPTAVVTPDLLLKGVANLRVADLSVVPNPVRFGGVSVGMMIGEKASAMILAADYTVNISPTHGLTVQSAFHGHNLVQDVSEGINNACGMAGMRTLNLPNDVNSCECQEAIAALVELGVPEAWVGSQKSVCRYVTSTGNLETGDCSVERPVLCKK